MGRIQFGEAQEDTLDKMVFPEALLHGVSVRPSQFFVLIDQDVWPAIRKHAERYTNIDGRGTNVECAGILAGQPFYDEERDITFVVMVRAIETEAESQGPGSVRIVPEGFRRAREQVDALGLQVVGWYHTHPNYGIFLSEDDKVVVRSSFNARWHIALVYDPIRDEVGYFRGTACERVDEHCHVVQKEWPPVFQDMIPDTEAPAHPPEWDDSTDKAKRPRGGEQTERGTLPAYRDSTNTMGQRNEWPGSEQSSSSPTLPKLIRNGVVGVAFLVAAAIGGGVVLKDFFSAIAPRYRS
jgi:proteasome lid subunit RPN8/RPN11